MELLTLFHFSFAGPVVYDTSQFLCTNRDVIPDDLITVFGKENCQFGFASHLFATELRNLQNNYPRGACFRISPAAGSASANTAISQGNLLRGIDNWSVAALVYYRNHYFGLGPIPKPKPKSADTFS